MREDRFSFTVEQSGGPLVTVHDAPRELNRIEGGIRLLFCRIRVERKTISWDELRRAAQECGVFIDPRDDQPPPAEKYPSMSRFIHYERG